MANSYCHMSHHAIKLIHQIVNRQGNMNPERIIEIREQTGMDSQEFAKFIGTYRSNVDRWEKGETSLTTSTKMMYRAFGFIQKCGMWKKFVSYLVND